MASSNLYGTQGYGHIPEGREQKHKPSLDSLSASLTASSGSVRHFSSSRSNGGSHKAKNASSDHSVSALPESNDCSKTKSSSGVVAGDSSPPQREPVSLLPHLLTSEPTKSQSRNCSPRNGYREGQIGSCGIPSSPHGTPHSALSTLCSYNYPLTARSHKDPPVALVVTRYVPTSRGPVWNSQLKSSQSSPKELLPRIDTHKESKYDYLSTGRSSSKTRTRRASIGSGILLGNDGADNDDVGITCSNAQSIHHEGEPLLKQLQTVLHNLDFSAAQREDRDGILDGESYSTAHSFFRAVSKGKTALTAEDLHALLLLCSSSCVALQEAALFLAEECEGHNPLSFSKFLHYGERIRSLLQEYECFASLSDTQKLLVTSARVLPGTDVSDMDCVRLRLLKARNQFSSGELPEGRPPFRMYELAFLVDYQRRLYSSNVASTETAIGSQHAAPQSLALYRPRSKNDDLITEDVSWGDGRHVHTPNISANDTQREFSRDDYPSLARCNKHSGAVAVHNNVATTKASPERSVKRRVPDSHNPRPLQIPKRAGRRPQRRRPSFNLELQPKPKTKKSLPNCIEDDYRSRRKADKHLIKSLQTSYAT